MIICTRDWWSEFLYGLEWVSKKVTEVTIEKPAIEKPAIEKPAIEKQAIEKFKWQSEYPRTRVQVPNSVRSIKLNMKTCDNRDKHYLVFIKTDGYTVIFSHEDLDNISSIDMSLPYIWMGIPPGTEYIFCTADYVYKFSHVSRNYYRAVNASSGLLPRTYQLVEKGSIRKLYFLEETGEHDPPITENSVLIMGQS
jgi:hypothetical protein